MHCNPFRKYLTFIYNINKEEIDDETFQNYLNKKVSLTAKEVEANNNEKDSLLKDKRIKDCLRE